MKKKFITLNNEIEAHKGEIQKMFAEERKLHGVIKSLEKDISGLKKEVGEVASSRWVCAIATRKLTKSCRRSKSVTKRYRTRKSGYMT